jgi:hypothetical protein
MARPTEADEVFIHQIPELLPNVQTQSPFWREGYFFEVHQPDALGDVVFFTMAVFPSRRHMDSIGDQMFLTMAARHARHAIDLVAIDLLG